MTPDPSEPADITDPQSWNYYSYAIGDPINFNDPEGLLRCGDILGFGTGDQTLSSLMNSDTLAGMFARVIWAESSANVFASDYLSEKEAVGWTILNRYIILHGTVTVTDILGNAIDPTRLGFVPPSIGVSATYANIIGYGRYVSVKGNGDASLTDGFQKKLDRILAADVSDTSLGPQIPVTDPATGQKYTVNEECFNIMESYVAGNLASQGRLPNPFGSKGLVTSFNTTGQSAGPNLQSFGRLGPTYFFGFLSSYVKLNGKRKPAQPGLPPRPLPTPRH